MVVHALMGEQHHESQKWEGGAGGDRPILAANRPEPPGMRTASTGCGGTQVGFVVSKAVGGAVVRNRVSRRLRHLMQDRLSALVPGTALVVRALPPAATASSRELAEDLDAALRRLKLLPAAPRGAGVAGAE
jgi:ribonuclease P protein component